MPCKTSLRTRLSGSSSASDMIKLQMSLLLIALWVIPEISNLCQSVSDVNCLKWHSAIKNICWAGRVIIPSPPLFKTDTSFWLEWDDCFQSSVSVASSMPENSQQFWLPVLLLHSLKVHCLQRINFYLLLAMNNCYNQFSNILQKLYFPLHYGQHGRLLLQARTLGLNY